MENMPMFGFEIQFSLGNLVCTNLISERIQEDPSFWSFVWGCLKRYIQCDWGDLDPEDKAVNDEAVKSDWRILAAYNIPDSDERIWIITEWDRSVTTILYPDEY